MQVLKEIVGFGDFSGPRNNPKFDHQVKFLQTFASECDSKIDEEFIQLA